MGVVGALQFDVIQARLEAEYGVPTVLEALPHTLARWVISPDVSVEALPEREEVLVTRAGDGRLVMLFASPFFVDYFAEKFPALRLATIDSIEAANGAPARRTS